MPGTNLIGFGNVWPFHVVDYNASDFVYVRVSGSISTTPIGCSGNGPTGTFGPWGHPANASFAVRIVNQAGYLFVHDQATQGTGMMVSRAVPDADGSVMVGRTGGGSTCLEYVNDKPVQKAGLAVSGSQTIHYEVYPIAELSVAPTFVVNGGAIFLSATSHWDIVDPVWVYQLGDTLPAGRGPRWGKEACTGDLSCTYVPPQSGRVYLTGKVHGLDVQVWGPIVWVRASIPDACTLPPGAAGAPMKADGPYAGPVCPPDPPPEEEEDSLVVSLTLSRDSVGPVLDDTFNAVTQYWGDPNTPARLDDVIDLQVHATWEPSGRAASGVEVTLSVEPVENSGGHPHGPRPKGTFFRMEDRPTAQEQQKCGDVPPKCVPGADLTLTLDETGSGSAVYRTSGVSGLEVVRAQASAAGKRATGADTVKIRWPGLIAMDRDAAVNKYYFSDQGHARHGDINHWVSQGMKDVLLASFDNYWIEQPAPRFTGSNGEVETRFVVTEASLEWGGLLDVDEGREWQNPHVLHRTGDDVDLRLRTLTAAQRRVFQQNCREEGLLCELHPRNGRPNHIHVYH